MAQKESERIELTQCDLKHLFTCAIQKGLLFLKHNPSEEQTLLLVQHLKFSLSCTLGFFTPLAGRLATVEHDNNTLSYFIECNNAGAQFIHAVADGVTIADILEPVYVPPIMGSFFPLNGVLNCEGVSKPLLAVQVTELVDGIFIACSMNHTVADGSSFWNFFNSWSAIHRESYPISKPLVLNRMLLCGTSNFLPISLPLSINNNNFNRVIRHTSQIRVFHFSKKKIAGLKEKANTEVATTSISSLQSLLAHIWKSTTRNRQVDLNKEVDLIIMVGLRKRMQPPLPEKYFGNAIVSGYITLKAREVLEHGLGHVAFQINRVVSSFTQDKVRGVLEYSFANPSPIIRGKLSPSPVLAITSSPRFNVYGTDFGWGTPLGVRGGHGDMFDGMVTLFPGMEEGTVEMEVCVLPETLQAIENDLEFMDAVTV